MITEIGLGNSQIIQLHPAQVREDSRWPRPVRHGVGPVGGSVLQRWVVEKLDEHMNATQVHGEPYALCPHLSCCRPACLWSGTKPACLCGLPGNWWFARYPHAIICPDCGQQIVDALAADDTPCDFCGDIGVSIVGQPAWNAKAIVVLCRICRGAGNLEYVD